MEEMPPFQLFWDLQQTSNLKWANFVHNILTFLSLNICYVKKNIGLCDMKLF